MNLRLFSMALLVSALPQLALAGHEVSFNSGDFLAAEKVSRDGQTVVSVKLSKSGKAKIKKLKPEQKVHTEVAGVERDLVMRTPIVGDKAQLGPYSELEAQKIIQEINKPN